MEETRAVASSGAGAENAVVPVVEEEVDVEALKKAKPVFLYYYVDLVTDPMDPNYKFSRKFELGILLEEVVETLNKNFVCKKIALPAEGDMKIAKNQARIEIWSPVQKKVGAISLEGDSLLNKSPFLAFLKRGQVKSEMAVKAEIQRVEKSKKEREEKAKKQETAKKED